MKVFYALLAIFCPVLLWAQPDGTPQSLTPMQRIAAQQQLLNGNDTLNRIYANTACGLNYTQASVRLGQRFLPVGLTQPAPLAINGIPGCAEIDTAFVWFELLGQNPPAPVITLTNPQGNSVNVQSQLVGTSVDVCWQMANTHVYRADVTSIISTNGTYLLSGIPVSAVITPPNVDAEGATLLVVYKDPSVSYTGTLLIDDGAATMTGGALSHTMTGFSACANSTLASAFMLVGDLQFDDSLSFNGNYVPFQFNWWNYIEDNSVQISSSQNSFNYYMNTGGDCYTFAVAGLYYQTACQTCVAVSNPINFTATVTPSSCNNNGAITISNITGGSGPYSLFWNNTSADTNALSNLAPGNYALQISGTSGCGGGTIVVPNSGVSANVSYVVSGCGVSSLQAIVSGGTAPYTYLWSPVGDTTSSINPGGPASYSVLVTDSNGCMFNSSSLLINPASNMYGNIMVNQSYCVSGGTLTPSVIGGIPPYSYLWNTGDTTSILANVPPGIYSLTISDQSGCVLTLTDSVVNMGPLNFMLGLPTWDTVACYSQEMYWVQANDPSSTYYWPHSGSTMTYAYYTPSGPGIDTVVVRVSNACDIVYDTLFIYVPALPAQAPSICGVGADPITSQYIIGWNNYPMNPGNTYEIYKEVPFNSGNYTLLATQPATQISSYADATSNASLAQERYQVIRIDTCGGVSAPSTAHVGVSLTATPQLPFGYQLNWTAYQGAVVVDQFIYRGTSATTLGYYTSVGPTATSFIDSTPGNWVYQVQAIQTSVPCLVQRLSATNSVQLQSYVGTYSNVSPSDISGVNQPLQSEAIAISPNPADGFFNLRFEAAGAARIRVYNIMGQEVYTDQVNAAGAVNMPLDLRMLALGVYMLQLDNGETVSTARLVIKRS